MKVLAFGSFDILHPGHLFYLKEAKKLGDFLIVIVARDSTIKKYKKKEPVNDEGKRLAEIKKLDFVDEAMLGYEGDYYKVLGEIKPEVIALGYDQTYFTEKLEEELKKLKLKTKIVRIKPFKEDIYKSSKMR